jgi:hypothetical protein
MSISTKITYISFLFCLLIGSTYTLDGERNDKEYIPLLPRNTAPAAPQIMTKSQLICDIANQLASAFENYSSLTPDRQENLMNDWQHMYNFCCAELGLSSAGFAERIVIPPETAKQLDDVFAIYKERKKSFCVIE